MKKKGPGGSDKRPTHTYHLTQRPHIDRLETISLWREEGEEGEKRGEREIK